MKTRRLKFQDLMIVAPDAGPDATAWLQTSGAQIAALCLEHGRSLRLITHAEVSPETPLDGSHLRLLTHAFGTSSDSTDEREPDIVREFLEGNRSFRCELNALDQLLAESREPLLILQNVSHPHLAAIADWLQTSAAARMVSVVLVVNLPPSSSGMARCASIQMVSYSLRSIREIINVTVFVAVLKGEEKAADVGLVHDATIYCMSPADLSHAAENGQLVLQPLAGEAFDLG